MARKRVLCCGLVCADFFNICSQYPVEDSDEHILKQYWQRGGNASNTSTTLAALNCAVEFFGVIPADSIHRSFFESDFRKLGIAYDHCVYNDSSECPQATIICSLETGSRTILYTNRHLPELSEEDFSGLDLTQYSWIHFEGRRNVAQILKMLELVDSHNRRQEYDCRIITSVELEKTRSELDQLVDKADYVFVGKVYATSRGYSDPEATCRGLAPRIRDGGSVIVAWGDQGARAVTNNTEKTLLCAPAQPPRKIVDSTGAGDTFIGAVIYKLNTGQSLGDAIIFGCQIAGCKIGDFGFDHISNH